MLVNWSKFGDDVGIAVRDMKKMGNGDVKLVDVGDCQSWPDKNCHARRLHLACSVVTLVNLTTSPSENKDSKRRSNTTRALTTVWISAFTEILR